MFIQLSGPKIDARGDMCHVNVQSFTRSSVNRQHTHYTCNVAPASRLGPPVDTPTCWKESDFWLKQVTKTECIYSSRPTALRVVSAQNDLAGQRLEYYLVLGLI